MDNIAKERAIYLENWHKRVMKNYEQYKDTDLHPMYLWSIGEIDFKTQVNMITEKLNKGIKQSPVEFIEQLYSVELTPMQKALINKLHNNSETVLYTGRSNGRKLIMDGMNEYRKYEKDFK